MQPPIPNFASIAATFCLGFAFGFVSCFAWLLSLDSVYANQHRLRPPAAIHDRNCRFILTGQGTAILLQHRIFECLFDPDGPSDSLAQLQGCSVALRLVVQKWTQVDTPSVARHASD